MKVSHFVAALVAAGIATSVLAQNQTEAKPKQGVGAFKLQDMQKAAQEAKKKQEEAQKALDPNDPMVKYGMPGEHHDHMHALVGDWKGEVKMWQAPGGEVTTSETKANIRMDMGDRYLRANYTGEVQQVPFRGLAFWGYNNLRKVYESTWIDNMGTGIMFSTGKCDGTGKVFTFTGEADDPASGKTVKERDVTTVIDSNSWKMEMFRPGPDGKEFKTMEITFQRIGGPSAPAPTRAGKAPATKQAPVKDGDQSATPKPASPK